MCVVNLVVSCAKRKTWEPRASLCLRAVRSGGPIRRRAVAWAARLAPQAAVGPATDLYAGEHWQVVRSVAAQSSSVRVWVASAGYGLVRLDTPLSAYSATFASGQPDSVCVAGGAAATAALPEWWAAVAEALAPHDGPRTLAAVARTYPDDFMLVALSTAYLAAVAPDLRDAALALTSERLAILSAGGRVPDTIAPFLLPARGELVGQVGGTMNALNARLARRLIQELGPEPFTYSRCQATVEGWSRQLAHHLRPARRRLSDREVSEFIRRQLELAGPASPAALLRRLRASGRACSQARFAALFLLTRGGPSAHG